MPPRAACLLKWRLPSSFIESSFLLPDPHHWASPEITYPSHFPSKLVFWSSLESSKEKKPQAQNELSTRISRCTHTQGTPVPKSFCSMSLNIPSGRARLSVEKGTQRDQQRVLWTGSQAYRKGRTLGNRINLLASFKGIQNTIPSDITDNSIRHHRSFHNASLERMENWYLSQMRDWGLGRTLTTLQCICHVPVNFAQSF